MTPVLCDTIESYHCYVSAMPFDNVQNNLTARIFYILTRRAEV
jgi:hypothetical protein